MDSSDRIKDLRASLKISTRAMAEALGVAPSVVTNWESGVSAVRKPNALALQTLYGVRWEWIMTGEGDMWEGAVVVSKNPSDAVVVPIFEHDADLERDGETPDAEEADGSRSIRLKVVNALIARAGEGSLSTLALVRVPRDPGMEPLLTPGGLVLVNTAQALRLHPPQGRWCGCASMGRASSAGLL